MLHVKDEISSWIGNADKESIDNFLRSIPSAISENDIIYIKAERLLLEHEPNKALELLKGISESSIVKSLFTGETFLLRAQLLQMFDEDEESMADLDFLLELHPSASLLYLQKKAALLFKLREEEALMQLYSKIIAQYGDKPELRLEWASYLTQMGFFQESIYYFSDFIEMVSFKDSSLYWVYLQRAKSYNQLGSYHLAISDLKTALSIDFSDAEIFLELISSCKQLGEDEELEKYLNWGLEVAQKDVYKLYRMAVLRAWEQKNFDQVLDFYHQMTLFAETRKEAKMGLAKLFLKQGDVQTAFLYLSQAEREGEVEAEELINRFCYEEKIKKQKELEAEKIAAFSNEIEKNKKVVLLNALAQFIWKVDWVDTINENSNWDQLPSAMSGQIQQEIGNLFFYMNPNGLLFYSPGKEDSRSLFVTADSNEKQVNVWVHPFQRNEMQEFGLEYKGDNLKIKGFGSGKTVLNLVFRKAESVDLQPFLTDFTVKKERGDYHYLGEFTF